MISSLVVAIVLIISAIVSIVTFACMAAGKKSLQFFMKSLKIIVPINIIWGIVDIVVVILFFLGV